MENNYCELTIKVPITKLAEAQEAVVNIMTEKPQKAAKKLAEAMNEESLPPQMPAAGAVRQITKSDIRALGVEFTKKNKQDELATALSKFGAKKLSEVKEEDYEALYKELGGK